MHTINMSIEAFRTGHPVSVENDLCISCKGEAVRNEEQPWLRENENEATADAALWMSTGKMMCRPWHLTPLLPLQGSGLSFTTEGRELVATMAPDQIIFRVVIVILGGLVICALTFSLCLA